MLLFLSFFLLRERGAIPFFSRYFFSRLRSTRATVMDSASTTDSANPTKNIPDTSANAVCVTAHIMTNSRQKSAGIHNPSVDSKNTTALAIPSTIKVKNEIMAFKPSASSFVAEIIFIFQQYRLRPRGHVKTLYFIMSVPIYLTSASGTVTVPSAFW